MNSYKLEYENNEYGNDKGKIIANPNTNKNEDILPREQYEILKANLMGIKEEFDSKVKNLIFIFSKIKNSKYFIIISQLLTKLDYHQKSISIDN